MWRDLLTAARAAVAEAGGPRFEIGGYDFRPGPAYQGVWSVDRLYPEWMQSSQVSTYTCLYPYHVELIGNEVREDRRRLPKSDVLPWLTPGDAGTFPGECLQWALLECYTNGARGVYFWSGRVWDTESLIAYNHVVRAIAPVERLILEGELAANWFRSTSRAASAASAAAARCCCWLPTTSAEATGRSTCGSPLRPRRQSAIC